MGAGHVSGDKLQRLLREGLARISVESHYMHYKEKSYRVTGLCVIEATDGLGVLYEADYPGLAGITFLRPLEEFLSEVEWQGKRQKRFKKI